MIRLLAFALLALALLMGWGFLRSDAAVGDAATLLALLVAVGLPLGAGLTLLFGPPGTRGRRQARQDRLRRETLDAELIRLAGERDGKLTVVEAVVALGIDDAEAKAALSSLVTRELADIHVTDSGLLVYAFHDVRLLHEKPDSRDVLDV
jgi:hypothetical protein